VPIHWRTQKEINRRFASGGQNSIRQGVDGYYDPVSGHIWVSHEANKKKTLDHELEHAFTEIRQAVWNNNERRW